MKKPLAIGVEDYGCGRSVYELYGQVSGHFAFIEISKTTELSVTHR